VELTRTCRARYTWIWPGHSTPAEPVCSFNGLGAPQIGRPYPKMAAESTRK
jgi:hypothetical protein